MSQRSTQYALELALVLVTAAVYAAVFGHGFINLDDDQYVSANEVVAAGVTGDGLVWAFTEFTSFNWHPLTWLSHMLDVSIFGMEPGAHHGVNLLFHLLNSVLVFRFLLDATAARWPAFVVAAWFALHPTHVESVAWIAERKDVLSTFFLLLTLRAYVGFERTRAQDAEPGSAWLGGGVVVWLVLGLMSKPMLVTTPFVLLLLDIWPLRRIEFGAGGFAVLLRCVREKWLLFCLVAASSALTYWAQASGGAMRAGSGLDFGGRLANAVVSLVRYLGKACLPTDLALYYPHPGGWPGSAIALSGAIVVGLSMAALAVARTRPWWLVGWLWFVGTLVPVLGFVQVGSQAMADRYTYVPFLGLFIAVAYGVYEGCRRRPARMRASGALAAVSVAALAFLSWQYVAQWRDSISIFTHSLHATDPDYPELLAGGKPEPSGRVPLHNGLYTPYYNLGTAYAAKGEWREARRHFEAAIVANATFPEVYINMGVVLAQQGDLAGSKLFYQRALDLDPTHELARRNLGLLMQMMR